MKRLLALIMSLVLIFTACGPKNADQTAGVTNSGDAEQTAEKYEYTFFDTFDTVVKFVAYMNSKETFDGYASFVEAEFVRLHRVFDNYKTYEGINNVKTINDNAGGEAIEVDPDLIKCIELSKEYYKKYSKKTNIAMGSVLSIWHSYREQGIEDPVNAKVPPLEELNEAAKHMDINQVKVDKKKNTIQLSDSNMSLDLGAIAKGYATELVAQKLREKGLESGIISAGGNVKTIGNPLDGVRKRWGIGIQNPDNALGLSDETTIEVLYVQGTSVVTSGDYQRFYTVGDKTYHHLIDPDELMPMNYYRSVSVITEDSALADFLSTAAYLLPFEESKKLIESVKGADALWIMHDNSIVSTENLKKVMKSQGATSKDE